MQRRQVLALAGAVGTGAVSGCTGVLGCGPGDDEISDIADNPAEYEEGRVSVQGEVTEMEDDGLWIVIDDGTGTARLSPPLEYVYDGDFLDEGDCHSDEGWLRDADDDRADVVIDTVPPE